MPEPWIIGISLKVEEMDQDVKLSVDDDAEAIGLHADEAHEVVTDDYRSLKNKPTINNVELFDNYNEIDPTVPAWAKREEPESLSYAEICEIWINN